ncbi:MAG TPA: hypothetical protein VHG72_03715, partial [Polyangia bacterium]|nr:hypothetical protein [Polyangia bacterium]
MHPAVAALPFEEKGLVLGALLARMPVEVLEKRFGGPTGARCRAALEALGAESRAARAGALAGLIALVRAPWPAGLGRVHPDWLWACLDRQSSAVIRALAAGLPAEARRVAEAILGARAAADPALATVHVSGPSAAGPGRAGARRLRRAGAAGRPGGA